MPGSFRSVGTDGFGLSEARAELRDYFEIDARYTALAALQSLAEAGHYDAAELPAALQKLNINPDKPDPIKPPEREAVMES